MKNLNYFSAKKFFHTFKSSEFFYLHGDKLTKMLRGNIPVTEKVRQFSEVLFDLNEMYGKYTCYAEDSLDDRETKATSSAVIMLPFFAQECQKIYKISNLFGNVLHEANCKISPKFINFKKERIFCIEFPDNLVFQDHIGSKITCAYVLLSGEDKPEEYKGRDNFIQVHYPTNAQGRMGLSGRDMITFSDDLDIEDVLLNTVKDTSGILRYVLKCILYIDSGEPDLTLYQPVPKPRNSKAIRTWRKEEHYEIPLIRIGWNYRPRVTFSKDQTTVMGHWRWQPYGPANAMVKLIFVEEHIRTFKGFMPTGVRMDNYQGAAQ